MDKDKSASGALHAQVRKRIGGASGFVLDVDFGAAPGFTIVFGASGAGKTTMLDCIAGLTDRNGDRNGKEPDSGRIAVGDQVLFDAIARIHLPVEKRNIGYVF